MNDNKEISDEMLMAYSDGELSSDEYLRIKEKLDTDEALRERLADFIETRAFLQTEYFKVKSEGVPERFSNLIQPSTKKKSSRLRGFFKSLFTMEVAIPVALSLVFGITVGVNFAPTVYQDTPMGGEYRGTIKTQPATEEKVWIDIDGTRKQVVVIKRFTVGPYVDCQVVKMEADSDYAFLLRCDDARDNTVHTITVK